MAIDATLTGANLAQTVEGVASTRQQRPFRQGAGKKNPRRSETYNGAPDKSAASEAAKEQKRILDGQIADIRAFAEQQRDAFEFANLYLKNTYDAGPIDLQAFYAEDDRVRQAGLQATLDALDKEEAALNAARSKAGGADRIAIENKIADAVAKRVLIEQKAGQDAAILMQQRGAEATQLMRRYDDPKATMLELGGDTGGAAAIRIKQQVDEARRLIRDVGGDPREADRYGAQLTNLERLRKSRSDYNGLIEHARQTDESILLVAQERGATEWETMRAVDAGRAKTPDQMARMVDEAKALAKKLDTDDAKRYAENLEAGFRRARAEASTMLQQVRSIGGEISYSLVGGLEDAIIAGEGYRGILKGIEQDLLRIGTRELFTKPAGGFLTNLIGGNGQASGGAGFIGSILSSLAIGLGGAPAVQGGYGLPGSFAGLFAGGGDIAAGKWGVAGENGWPELIRGPAHVVPHNRSMAMLNRVASQSRNDGSRSIVLSPAVHVNGPLSLKTQKQANADMARMLTAANARLN